jgi:hypothetical protein
LFIAFGQGPDYVVGMGGGKIPRLTPEAGRDLEQKRSCTMTFLPQTRLPKTGQSGHDLIAVLFAVPMSVIGTGLLFALINAGGASLGA